MTHAVELRDYRQEVTAITVRDSVYPDGGNARRLGRYQTAMLAEGLGMSAVM